MEVPTLQPIPFPKPHGAFEEKQVILFQIEDKESQISLPLFSGQKEQVQPLEEVGFHEALAHPRSSLHNQPKQI